MRCTTGSGYRLFIGWRRTRLLHALAPVAIATCLGCAGQKQHSEGRELMRAGEYDRAVEVLREAVQHDRYNARYQVDLADAEAMAADRNLADAEKLLEENRATEAREELRIALGQMPGHPEAIVLMNTVEAKIRSSAALTDQARTAMGQGRHPEALQLLNEALRTDANNPQARHLRELVVTAGTVELPPDAPAVAVMSGQADDDIPPALAAAAAARPERDEPARAESLSGPVAAGSRPPAGTVDGAARTPTTRPSPVATRGPGETPSVRESRQTPASPPVVTASPYLTERVQGTLSRDDKRYPKEMLAGDGILLKLSKTRRDPLTADLEIKVDKFKKKYKRLRIGARIYGRGQSRQPYQIVILGINDARKTLHFALEPLARAE